MKRIILTWGGIALIGLYCLNAVSQEPASPAPGDGAPHRALHRLNRAEYANAVRDLLAIDIDAAPLLPPDDAGYGFDNNGDVLIVSPTLLDRYLSAADKISRLATGDPAISPVLEAYDVPR